MHKLLLKNAVLIDKQNGYLRCKKDVLVENGIITKIEDSIAATKDTEVLDVKEEYVSAGLIDVHVHNFPYNCYQGPEVKPDMGFKTVDPIGVLQGATAVIECGSIFLPEAEKFVKASNESETRHFALFSAHSNEAKDRVAASVNDVDIQRFVDTLIKYKDYFKGVKITASNRRGGLNCYGLVKNARKIAEQSGTPVTVHIGSYPPDPNGIVEFLEKGDVVTHVYNGKTATLFQPDGTPKEPAARARARGVLFDVGHGTDSFSYPVFDKAYRKGFYPDLVSTDVRKSNVNGPAYSLAVVMSEVLNLGMPLEDIVHANTFTAANTYSLGNIGQLKVGYQADFTIFSVKDVKMEFEDSTYNDVCTRNIQKIDKLIVPSYAIVSKTDKTKVFKVTEGIIV